MLTDLLFILYVNNNLYKVMISLSVNDYINIIIALVF